MPMWPEPVLTMSRPATRVSSVVLDADPTPWAARMYSTALGASTSAGLSPPSLTAPPLVSMTTSALEVLLSLPSVMSPVACRRMEPPPAARSVSPVMVSAPLRAISVMSPPLPRTSACSLRVIAAAASTVRVPAPPTVTACCRAMLPAVVRSSTLSVRVVIAPCTVSVPPAVKVTALSSPLSMRKTVAPSFSAMSIAPLERTSSVSASSVVSALPMASRVPAVTVPLRAVSVTAPACAMLPMMMFPFSEVMLTRPARPVIAVIRMSPSAKMVMSPPVPAFIAIVLIAREPVSAPREGFFVSLIVRSPGWVKVTDRLSTRVFSVRSLPAVTLRFWAVTKPPSVRLAVAASVTEAPCKSDTTTSEAGCDTATPLLS